MLKACRLIIAIFILFVGITGNSSYIDATESEKLPAQREILTGAGLSEEEQAGLKEALMPLFPYNIEKTPPAPDYWMPEAWAALPFREDEADVTPANTAYPQAQDNAMADVFFVHPTGYASRDSWNAPWDGSKAAKETANMMRYCASVYNAACRVYAPRYRQCTVYAVLDNETSSGIKAIDLAYSDVERAFEHYIEFWNAGRPFILAGHSQGTFHLLRLLQEKVINRPFAGRMIASYLIGYPIPEETPGIKLSRDAIDTGTVIGWNTYTENANHDFFTKYAVIWLNGSYQKIAGRPIIQTNPLSWKLHGGKISREKNLGSLPVLEPDKSTLKLIPDVTGADASGSVLIITKPEIVGFPGEGPDMPILNADLGDYHMYDYALFYENLRKNVVERTKAFNE